MRIMFPLISGVAELRDASAYCADVLRRARAKEGIAHDPKVPIGAMVETPSAAFIADLLAAECDFLSVGTNDLIQYALAADRENEDVGYLYHPLHPAILRALTQIVEGAGRATAGRDVRRHGGRSAAGVDPDRRSACATCRWRRDKNPVLKSIVHSTKIADAERLARAALELRTEIRVEELVYGAMRERFPLELVDEEAS